MDGPAGAGKSSVAKRVAKKLNLAFLDTGAMYRALTLKAMSEGVNLKDEEALFHLAKRTSVELRPNAEGVNVFLDGKDVSEDIRTLEVTNNTFYIARAGKVRSVMVEWQRKMAQKSGVVAEGRDIGSVVFPNADFKFYLDADVKVRAKRRHLELKQKGVEVDLAQLEEEVEARDHKDRSRDVGPLVQAADAILVDSTSMTLDENVDFILDYIQEHLKVEK